jgi:protein gp37
MGEVTGISWTTSTHNWWWGCTKVVDRDCVEEGSTGTVDDACRPCYANAVSVQYGWSAKGNSGPALWGPGAERRFFGAAHWEEPKKWAGKARQSGKPWRVFCGSMFDIFELHRDPAINAGMNEARERGFRLIDETGDALTWMLLSKRPENALSMLPADWLEHPRPYVWLGTSAAGPRALAKRWPCLAAIPASIHFLSWEPAIAPIADYLPLVGLDWIICGSESNGIGAGRPSDLQWFRDVRDKCQQARTPVFMKQLTIDGRLVKDVNRFPADLRLQEFPRTGAGSGFDWGFFAPGAQP